MDRRSTESGVVPAKQWVARAACLSTDLAEARRRSDMAFAPDIATRRAFVAEFCDECPVRRPCLEAAVARGETVGTWGGVANPKHLAV